MEPCFGCLYRPTPNSWDRAALCYWERRVRDRGPHGHTWYIPIEGLGLVGGYGIFLLRDWDWLVDTVYSFWGTGIRWWIRPPQNIRGRIEFCSGEKGLVKGSMRTFAVCECPSIAAWPLIWFRDSSSLRSCAPTQKNRSNRPHKG
eukprot:1188925-Prorocentrum_minimum.AAC.1